MSKNIWLSLLFFAITGYCMAQEQGRMETVRPDQTECPFIVKKGWIQAEIGFNIERENGYKTFVHPTVLWKYGASKRFEFRLITEAVSVESPIRIPPGYEMLTGVLPLQIGGKLSLWEEKGLLPKTSFIFHIAPSKLGSKKFHTKKWTPNFRFTLQHTLSENIGLGYNIGAEWDGYDNRPAWVYTISPGFNLGKKWYAYAEAFGALKKGETPEHAFDGGIAYYISDNVKVDISSGIAVTDAATDWYSAIGISIRFRASGK